MRRWRIVADTWRKPGTPVERLVVDIAGERIVDVVPAKDLPSTFETITFPSPALLIPGFCDSHTHLLTGALSLNWVSLAGVRDVDEAAVRLETAAHESDGQWLDGHGFEESELSLDRRVLDRIVPDIPVFIRSHDLHSAVVNSRTLARAQITERTTDPPRGRFDRGADGQLNGLVREHACDLLLSFRPPLTKQRAHQALLQAQGLAFSLGITATGVSARQDLIPFYRGFAQSPQAKLRLDL